MHCLIVRLFLMVLLSKFSVVMADSLDVAKINQPSLSLTTHLGVLEDVDKILTLDNSISWVFTKIDHKLAFLLLFVVLKPIYHYEVLCCLLISIISKLHLNCCLTFWFPILNCNLQFSRNHNFVFCPY